MDSWSAGVNLASATGDLGDTQVPIQDIYELPSTFLDGEHSMTITQYNSDFEICRPWIPKTIRVGHGVVAGPPELARPMPRSPKPVYDC